jgi:hypothetical protein
MNRNRKGFRRISSDYLERVTTFDFNDIFPGFKCKTLPSFLPVSAAVPKWKVSFSSKKNRSPHVVMSFKGFD